MSLKKEQNTKKIKTIEDAQEIRKELYEKFDGDIPDNLVKFIDKKENRILKDEWFKQKWVEKQKEIKERGSEVHYESVEKFWKENKYEIKKKDVCYTTDFEDASENEHIIENEKDISDDERRILVSVCEKSLYSFAIRYFQHYLKYPSSRLHRYLYKFLELNFGDVKKKRKPLRHCIAAPRSNAKCLKYDTEIQLSNGSLKKIKDIVPGDEIISLNKNLKEENDFILSCSEPQEKNVVDIKLSSGRKLSLTKDHRLLTIDGYKPLRDLTVGDRVAAPRTLVCDKTKGMMKKSEAIFIANMLAEGCLSKGVKLVKYEGYSFKCTYTNFDEEVVEDFKKACDDLGFEIEISNDKRYYKIRKARDYLRILGMDSTLSKDKTIPDIIFEQDSAFLETFISRFIATDGWISKYNPAFGITLASERMVDQLYTILLRLGFLPCKQKRPNKKAGAFAVVCHGTLQLKRLAKIGVLHKQKKLEQTIERFDRGIHHCNIDLIDKKWKKYLKTITPHFLRKLYKIRVDGKYDITREKLGRVAVKDNNKYLKDLSESDVLWDKIVSISDEYKTITYDIMTEKNENFVANNIFSHNSALVSCIFPLWCILYKKKKFIILVSDTAGQAVDFLSDVKRELEYNELLLRDFPHAAGKGPSWKAEDIITNNGVRVMSLGTLSKIRGRRFGKDRPDLLLFDDLENGELVRSKVSRDFLRYQWFNKDALFCGDLTTDFIVVGTVLGHDSLLNALLTPSEYPDWTSKKFQAVDKFSESPLWDDWKVKFTNVFDPQRKETALKFFEENREEMLKGVEVLWPEGDPYYDLMIYKLSDPSGFSSEKQNSPVDPSKLIFPEDRLHFKNFTSDPEIIKLLKDKRTNYFGALDPALSKKDSSDPSVIATIARTESGLILVVDLDMKRRSVDNQIFDVLKAHLKFNYLKFGVEENGFQIVLKDTLLKLSRREGIYAPVEGIQNYGDKHMRILSIAPHCYEGTIIFDSHKYKHNVGYAEALNQLLLYTENASHDDVPDALEMAYRISIGKRFKLLVKSNKK